MNQVFRIHGLPCDVVSDRGPQFVSAFWREFCRCLGATTSLSSGFHPQTNGQTERANQDLERVLRCLSSQNPTSWCMPITRYLLLPLGCLLFNALWVTNLLCFLPRSQKPLLPLSRPSSGAVSPLGDKPGHVASLRFPGQAGGRSTKSLHQRPAAEGRLLETGPSVHRTLPGWTGPRSFGSPAEITFIPSPDLSNLPCLTDQACPP